MEIKNLKRQAVASLLLTFLLMFLAEITQAEERLNLTQRFSIKISSGLSYLTVGDINTFLDDANERHIGQAQYFDGSRHGELKKIGQGLNSEIELTFDITSRLGIYLGAGHVYGRRESSSGFEVLRPGFFQVNFTFAPEISICTIALKLGSYYIIPFNLKARLFINSGIGYYISKTIFHWKQIEIWTREDGSQAADFREMVEWDLSSKGIGFQGGIGFEYNITNNLALVIEAQTRYARINKLKGVEMEVGSGLAGSFHGAVYYGEEKDLITDKYYSFLGFYEEKPDNPNYKNVRDAVLDLSGFFLKIGIRIRLF